MNDIGCFIVLAVAIMEVKIYTTNWRWVKDLCGTEPTSESFRLTRLGAYLP